MTSKPKQTKISSFFKSYAGNVASPKDASAGSVINTADEPQSNTANIISTAEGPGADDTITGRSVQKTNVEALPAFKTEAHIIEDSGVPPLVTEHSEVQTTEDASADYVIETPQDLSFKSSEASSSEDASKASAGQSQDTRYTVSRISSTDLIPFKRLLNTLLPVSYSPSFFTSIQQTNSAFSRIAKWHHRPGLAGLLIGGIKCRLEPVPPLPGPDGVPVKESQLYIQTIGVLAPYRRFGVANALLEEVFAEVRDLGPEHLESMGQTRSVCAHVWQESSEALEWYKKRGFVVEEVVEEYYTRLKPHGAWLVRKQLL